MKGRVSKKTLASSDDAASSDATDDLYELFEPESEEEVRASLSSSSEHLESDGSEYVPRGRNAKRAAAIKGHFRFTDCCRAVKNCTCTHSSFTHKLGYITILSTADDRYHLNGLVLDIRLFPTVEC